jgi:hypothetical protein
VRAEVSQPSYRRALGRETSALLPRANTGTHIRRTPGSRLTPSSKHPAQHSACLRRFCMGFDSPHLHHKTAGQKPQIPFGNGLPRLCRDQPWWATNHRRAGGVKVTAGLTEPSSGPASWHSDGLSAISTVTYCLCDGEHTYDGSIRCEGVNGEGQSRGLVRDQGHHN